MANLVVDFPCLVIIFPNITEVLLERTSGLINRILSSSPRLLRK